MINKRILTLAAIVTAMAGAFYFDLGQYLSFDALRENRQFLLSWYSEHQVMTIIIFSGLYATMVAVSLPGAVWMTLAGGFLFGTVQAAVYVVVSATTGAVIIFLIARYTLSDFFHAKSGAALRKMETGFQQNALNYLLVLRLVPLFPFWLVNLVPALLGVKLRTYVLATFFGIMPGSLVYCSVGNGLGAVFDAGETPDLGIIFTPDILLPILGLALLSLIPVLYKKIKAAKTIQ